MNKISTFAIVASASLVIASSVLAGPVGGGNRGGSHPGGSHPGGSSHPTPTPVTTPSFNPTNSFRPTNNVSQSQWQTTNSSAYASTYSSNTNFNSATGGSVWNNVTVPKSGSNIVTIIPIVFAPTTNNYEAPVAAPAWVASTRCLRRDNCVSVKN